MKAKFVTSFSLHRVDRQQYCIDTWKTMGLSVLAIQLPGEIDILRNQLKGVDEWKECSLSGDMFRRSKCPRITELTKQAVDAPVIVINSDISTKGTAKEFANEWLLDEQDETLVCGIRKDYDRAGGRKDINPYGIDAFRITPKMAATLVDRGWCIGYPGWDYAVAIELYQAGFSVRAAKFSLLHPRHGNGYDGNDVKLAKAHLAVQYRIPKQAITTYVQAMTGRYGRKKVGAKK